MTDQNYSKATAGLVQIRRQLDDLIGEAYGVQSGQAGWFIVVRARDQLFRLEQDFDRLDRLDREARR